MTALTVIFLAPNVFECLGYVFFYFIGSIFRRLAVYLFDNPIQSLRPVLNGNNPEFHSLMLFHGKVAKGLKNPILINGLDKL